ncbi:MAG: phosphoribosylamine--glycine ligase [Candidatus Cloacimonetes bacterium]|nr:phosphoribosylamine--glycine ligase [Candidatus Cloacimonadota bacterium]
MKNILVLGSGAREHTIADAFNQSKHTDKIFVMPGNDGIKKYYQTVPQEDFNGILDFVENNKIDLVFVGGEQLLSEGISDFLLSHNIKVIGPTKDAAQIESSKVFAKNLMQKYNIPTANSAIFNKTSSAISYLKGKKFPIVLKADGLAAGKGVIIASNFTEAELSIKEIMLDKKFGEAGSQIVIEDFLYGEEASIFAFCDGDNYVSTIFSQDHKRVFDEDKGLNTGGMGAFAPVDKFTKLKKQVDEQIFTPILSALKKENCSFSGVLYAGLMINNENISVIEFNCRLGDPETQVILPLLKNDFYELCTAISNKTIHNINLEWEDKYAVTVVLASKGYPESFEKGKQIYIDSSIEKKQDIKLYYAGVKDSKELNCLVNNGGRVISLTSLGISLIDAINSAYNNLKFIKSDILRFRHDIGKKGLQ